MRALKRFLVRLRNVATGQRGDERLREELEEHVAMQTEENIRAGMIPMQAQRQARLTLGGVESVRDEYHAVEGLPGLESLVQDARFALRQMIKSPGFVVIAVLTLSLGIGANTAIFSIVNAVLLHPAGVRNPSQVAVLHTRYTKFSLDAAYISTPTYTTARSLSRLVEAGALQQYDSFNIRNNGEAEHVAAARVSSQWFQVYGARPILGRTFTPTEDQPNAGHVVVLSYGFWQRFFGGRSNVVGQTLMLDETAYRVIGVMRSDFAWPRRCEVWVPIALPPEAFAPRHGFDEWYQAVVRLRPDVSVQQLNAALSATMWSELRRLGGAKYARSSGWSIYATPLTDFAAGSLRMPLFILTGVVALVMLIAAANVAGLFLARTSARTQEFVVRMALGAGSGRISRQILVETSLLAALACVTAAAAGPLAGRLLLRIIPNNLAAGYAVHLTPVALGLTVGATLLTVLISSVGPTLIILRQKHGLRLHEGGRSGTATAEKQRLRRAFVIAEVAGAFVLLTATGLFLASLKKLQQVDPGFNPRNVLTGVVNYADDGFLRSQPQQAAFVSGVIRQMASQPGVVAAAAVEPLPFDPQGLQSCSFSIIGHPVGAGEPGPHSHYSIATPGYLQVMQIPLLAGRWFNASDLASAQPVAVIDERLAKHYWPAMSPLGQQISFGCGGTTRPAVVIGVVATIRESSLEQDSTDGMRYYAFAQSQANMDKSSADFVVRTVGDPEAMLPALKRAVSSTNSSQAITGVMPMETLVQDSLAGRRLIVWMLGAFGGLALLLTAVGIYGLINYLAAQRINEMGVRMALGARRGDVIRLILSKALEMVAIGLGIGAVCSFVTLALLRSILPHFGGSTVASFGLAASTMLLVGGLAGLLPALRAASVEPIQALRSE
jgi:predicted permease